MGLKIWTQDNKQQLVDRVIEQIEEDVADGDFTAIDELLMQIDVQVLIDYLPEGG